MTTSRKLIIAAVLLAGAVMIALLVRRSGPTLVVSFTDFHTNSQGVLAMITISNCGPDTVSFDIATISDPPVISHEGPMHPHSTRVHALPVPKRPCQILVTCRERFQNTNTRISRALNFFDNLWRKRRADVYTVDIPE